MQAGCQCRATSGDSFNCIVLRKLRGTGQLGLAAIRGVPVARFHQDGGFRPVVLSERRRRSDRAEVNAELLEAAYKKLPVKEVPKRASEHPITLAG